MGNKKKTYEYMLTCRDCDKEEIIEVSKLESKVIAKEVMERTRWFVDYSKTSIEICPECRKNYR